MVRFSMGVWKIKEQMASMLHFLLVARVSEGPGEQRNG